jgi:L-ascorbate metabolism protein UlaG (beta-lactamase superfamily)
VIEPAQSDGAFLADVQAAMDGDQHFSLWWLGQSGYLIKWRGHHALLDPYLSDSLTKKYAATEKPHVRMTRRVVAPERLNFIDVVTSSHNHTDHLDGETLRPLIDANPDIKIIVPGANRVVAADRLQVGEERLTPIDDGQTVVAGPFSFSALPSAHEQLERDDAGRYRYLGYVVRFGSWAIYHSGDCCDYPGLDERLRALRIDVALLPINGRAPERKVAGNMSGREAAALSRRIDARICMPHHFDMFEFNTATPDDLLHEAARLGVRVRVLANGERWQSRELGLRPA